jgi:hypothetical protein
LVCADSVAALLPDIDAGWRAEAQLVAAAWTEAIIDPCAGTVPSRNAVPLTEIVEPDRAPICDDAGCEVGCETRPASCVMLRFNAEPNVDSAFIVVVDESPPNKVDSAAALGKGRSVPDEPIFWCAPQLCRNLHPQVSAVSNEQG